jgi:type I restriction enzyme, S subunit
MSRYKAYPAYRDSGVEWLGEIPRDWKVLPLKFLARIKNGQDYKEVEADDGYPVIGSGGQFSYATKYSYDKESVLLGRKGTIDKPLYVNEPFWTVDTMYYTEINQGVPPKFLYYLALTIQFSRYSTNTALPSMTQENLGNYVFAIPEDEQDRTLIASFLDHETAKIDALIEKQQRLIELLKEKRQAVISHAVTKGLNPSAPMKDSGVEWLGEVPAHWQLTQIKHLVAVFEQGWSPQCDSRPAEDGEYGVLKVGCVNGGVFNPEENKALPTELKPQTQYVIKSGDLLVSRANTRELVGSAAVVNSDFDKLILCDKLYRLRLHPSVNAELVALYLSIPPVRQQIELGTSGASDSMQNISQSVIRDLIVLLPPETEANLLFDELERKIAKFTAILKSAATQISYLQERRAALISAAVTGKIDVRDWQGTLDDSIRAAINEADAGDFASSDEVAATFAKYGA